MGNASFFEARDFPPVPERRVGEKERRGGNLKGNILSSRLRRDWIRYKVIGLRRRRMRRKGGDRQTDTIERRSRQIDGADDDGGDAQPPRRRGLIWLRALGD